jgi:hypothetical protein
MELFRRSQKYFINKSIKIRLILIKQAIEQK